MDISKEKRFYVAKKSSVVSHDTELAKMSVEVKNHTFMTKHWQEGKETCYTP